MQDPTGDDLAPSEPIVAPVPPPHAPPRWAPLTLVAFVGLVVCTNVANVVWARWANTNPEGLMALSSRQRYLVLAVAGGISPFWYVVIGAARIAAAFLVCHVVGRAYREQALSWFTRYLGMSRSSLDTFNSGFAKAEVGLVPFFAGSNIVGVLTGIHRTPPLRLAILLGVGIAGRLALMWFLAKAFEDQLLDVLGFLQRYQWWALGISLAAVIGVNVRNLRRGDGS
ncbi:MAG: hypothetical protein ABW328_13485 [Ilumatobacteraceae bacterium]